MFERTFIFLFAALVLALVACGDAREPIPGSSGTPTATGADSLPAVTPTSDIPDAKLTAIAAATPVVTPPPATACPLDAQQCEFASNFDQALRTGNIDVLTARITLSTMTCPTFEDFLRYTCEGNPGEQVEAFSYVRKLPAFLSINDARQWLAEFSVSALPAQPRVAAVGCPTARNCVDAFAIVLRAQYANDHPQVLLISLRASNDDWLIDSAQYLIGGDAEPVLMNGNHTVAANGKDVEYTFTRWQP